MHPIRKIDIYNIKHKAYVTTREIKTNFKELSKMANIKFKPIGKLHIKYGFNTIDTINKHIEQEDSTGKTIGCGCTICMLRHRKYIAMKTRRSYKKQLKAMDKLYNKVISQKKNYITPDKFESIFDRINYQQGSKLFGKRMLKRGITVIRIPIINRPIYLIPPTKRIYISRILALKSSLRNEIKLGDEHMLRIKTAERRLINLVLDIK